MLETRCYVDLARHVAAALKLMKFVSKPHCGGHSITASNIMSQPSRPPRSAPVERARVAPSTITRAPLIHLYLQGSVASIATLPRLPQFSVARYDVMILLSLGGQGSFDLQAGDQLQQGLQAVAVAPSTRLVVHAGRTPTAYLPIHPLHPRFSTVRSLIKQPVQPIDRENFAALNGQLLAASRGQLTEAEAGRLIDDILDVTLTGVPSAPPLDHRVHRMLHLLDKDLNHPFESFAAEFGLSPSRLSHLFSQALGMPFRSYLTWCRVMQAWEMVALKPEMSFTEIAHVVGFSDSAHLARSFHLNFGITPTMMRDRDFIRIIGKPLPVGQHVPAPPDELVRNEVARKRRKVSTQP